KILVATENLVASLKRQMEEAKAEASLATSNEASIESMVRNADIKRQQYSELYKKARELETERRVLLGSTRLVSLAETPTKPFFPKRIPFLAAGFILGMLLSSGAVLLRDGSDGRIQPSSATASATGIPTIAQLPHLQTGKSAARGRWFSSREDDMPLGEALARGKFDARLQHALRKLHVGLNMARGNAKLRSVLITSPGTKE